MNGKFVNKATSKKIIRDAEKALKDFPGMWEGPKQGFRALITLHKRLIKENEKKGQKS